MQYVISVHFGCNEHASEHFFVLFDIFIHVVSLLHHKCTGRILKNGADCWH